MNREEIKNILEDHKKWLDGTGGKRAIIKFEDMQYPDLEDADLRFADMQGASLWGANLCGADMRGADLRHADLRLANLQAANLFGADLRGANMRHANTDAMKTDEKTKIDWPMDCPKTGSFIAWKRAGEYIVKLEIPEDAERSSATTNTCRASKAKVLEIQHKDGTKSNKTEVQSLIGKTYKISEMAYPDEWDDNRWNECSHGIHFFMTREEAVAWLKEDQAVES